MDADLPSIAAALDRDPTTLAAPLHDLPADQRESGGRVRRDVGGAERRRAHRPERDRHAVRWWPRRGVGDGGLPGRTVLSVAWPSACSSSRSRAIGGSCTRPCAARPRAPGRRRREGGARHAAHLVGAVEAAPIELTGTPAVVPWYVEHLDHLRAALRFALKTNDGATAVRRRRSGRSGSWWAT
ncbi:MAG: hypothetical protein U0470_13225 [Anaerolineae bacterium]